MTPTAAIEVRELRKSYGELEAVRGIDFSVQRGEIYGLSCTPARFRAPSFRPAVIITSP